MNNNPTLKVEDISITISGKPILQDISFELFPKDILTIIGPNGAGKSTLIKIILGLLQPDSGKVILASGIKMGYMPQKINLTQLMPITVERFLNLSIKATKDNLEKYSNILGIKKLLNSEVISLSGGELQRVLLARALLNEPDLLILDEPTQGVDIKGQAELYKIISRFKEELGFSVLLVSHDLHLVMSGTDKVICLNKHVCCSGYPESVKKNPEFIQLFGETDIDKIAVYSHKHDHSHDLTGRIINDNKE